MPRLPHGRVNITPDALRNTRDAIAERTEDITLAFAMTKPMDTRNFDFLFRELQENDNNLLPEAPETVKNLIRLGHAMADDGTDASTGDSEISAAYTYFGQFVDHDITLASTSQDAQNLLSPNLAPLKVDEILKTTKNIRTAVFELDSVYGRSAPRDEQNRAKMKIGPVSKLEDFPEQKPFLRPPETGPKKADENDLPRRSRSASETKDRAARIGDHRNDENTIISQLHVAFLLAHNKLVDQGNSFRKAKRILLQHYQYIVLHDFLKEIADPQIVNDTINNGARIYRPEEHPDEFFMPLEFSVAAYRFGHSMVRTAYDFNLNFNTSGSPGTSPATLGLLFTFTALSGQLGEDIGLPPSETLPENWIIEWENFFEGGDFFNKARRIDTMLVEPLQKLRDEAGRPLVDSSMDTDSGRISASLAVRNLLRGYLLRMPTGQAVADALGIPKLSATELRQGAGDEQVEALEQGGFLDRTPLWYYILVEAAVHAEGQHLGPVGSTIVAEVLVELIRLSPNSILRQEEEWKPTLDRKQQDTFTLPDLLRFAGVLR